MVTTIGTSVHALDWNRAQQIAADIGDLLLESAAASAYISARKMMYADPDAAILIRHFESVKRVWEDVSQYGPFHPDYRAALDKLQQAQTDMDAHPAIARFQAAENRLDDLFFQVSKGIAGSVSGQIKVPSNSLSASVSSGCGGNCNGGCG